MRLVSTHIIYGILLFQKVVLEANERGFKYQILSNPEFLVLFVLVVSIFFAKLISHRPLFRLRARP